MQHALTSHRQRHSDFLHQLLDNQPQIAPVLLDAMKYAVLLGGKRIRPFLVYATGELLGASADDLDAPAAAIECIHAYSLVHDDLPAMDNDSLRRGQPTCHIAFDEATAILAGDALQTLSFEILTSHPYTAVSDRQQLQMVRTLAKASGQAGMCGGQALDLAATDRQIGLSALEQIHRHKTGALIVAAVQMAIQCSPQVSQESEQALLSWAQTIGLAFQVQDDILDETGATEALGKPQGSDQELHKSTYPALLGLTQAQQLLHDLQQKALQALAAIPYNTQLLEQFTDYLITRDR
ncbi:(2E,6E)-farnesyl diphosphate synthase [Aliidiomarina minuta]|uniref:(2E,6E)-farnesyl diphosphate synthase n=1 Tax=Aliidiomarina minuta TaxID=880057 RepID=A0A432W4V8_9GAMM|nr:(2E,6E)-farnesyl diphosphate synthase [Aliidiomarina minuta]